MASLVLFAYLLTLVDAEHAGRTYAAYGGVYILSALLWLWIAEGVKPDRWDTLGVAICLVGAGVILLAPRPVWGTSASSQREYTTRPIGDRYQRQHDRHFYEDAYHRSQSSSAP